MDILLGFGINLALVLIFAIGYKLGQRKTVKREAEELTQEQKDKVADLNRQQEELLNYNVDKVYGG